MKRNMKRNIISAVLISMLLILCSACADKSTTAELKDSDIDLLMRQVAEKESDSPYSKYLHEETFANAEFFATDCDEDNRTAYVWLHEETYAEVNGKAYSVSGSSGAAIIHFSLAGDTLELKDVTWAEDGELNADWIKDNFSSDAYAAYKKYDAWDEDGENKLGKELCEKAEKEMGVPVESDNLLEIDISKGTYKIVRTEESGEPVKDYKFEVFTIEKGKLSDLKE